MDLLTFIDYDLTDRRNKCMVDLFLRSLDVNLPSSAKVTIIGNPRNSVKRLAESHGFGYVELEPLPGYHLNVGWKLHSLCQWKSPFICLDCDTYALSDLSPLVAASADKPWFCVPCYVDNAVAGGVQVCSDPDFLDWDRIKSFAGDGKAESPMLKAFCEYLGYVPFHDSVDLHWNMVHWMAQRYYKEDNRWRIVSTLNKQANIIHFPRFMRWKPNPIYDEYLNSHPS